MPRLTPEQLNARDAERIEKRRRALARARDTIIGDLESTMRDLMTTAPLMVADGFDVTEITAAVNTLNAYIDHRIDAALREP